MIRIGPGDKLVIASHNPGKVAEIDALLSPFGVRTAGAVELGLPEPEETGGSFSENARIKAESAANETGDVALADDSGLCVAALGGAPGIHSARWAGPTKDFRFAMARIESALKEKGERDFRAWFVCVLALAAPEHETELFEGRVFGTLAFPPRGEQGIWLRPDFRSRGISPDIR